MSRETEAFELRGKAEAVATFAGVYRPMLSEGLYQGLIRVACMQLRLAHALTLPPTRFHATQGA